MKTKYLFLLLILFTACNNELSDNNYKKIIIDVVKEIELPNIDNSNYVSYINNYCIIDNREVFIIYRKDLRKLLFYDIKTKTIFNEIKLGFSELYHFNYINKDSIFLLYVNQLDPNNYVNDGQLVRVNFNGKIVEHYNYNNPLIWNKENQPLSPDSAFYPSLLGNKLNFVNDKVFLFLDRQKEYNIGTKEFIKNKSSIFAYYDLKNKKLINSNKIWYPNITEGDYYPSDFNTRNHCITEDGFPLLRFFYSSILYKWDYNKNKIIKYKLKSKILDTIPPIKHNTRYSDNNINAMYLDINYDKYNKIYHSILYFSPEIYGNGAVILIIADKNLNYIGEALAPRISFKPIFTKDYIITTTQSKKRGYFKLVYSKIKYIDTDNYNNYIETLKSGIEHRKDSIEQLVCDITGNKDKKGNKASISNYLKNDMNINDSTYAVISIYETKGCPSCKSSVLKFIGYNQATLNKVPFYLNLSGTNTKSITEYLNNNNIYNINNLFIDTLNKYSIFDNFEIKNPRLTLVENREIISDTVYNPSDIETGLIPKLMKHLGLVEE